MSFSECPWALPLSPSLLRCISPITGNREPPNWAPEITQQRPEAVTMPALPSTELAHPSRATGRSAAPGSLAHGQARASADRCDGERAHHAAVGVQGGSWVAAFFDQGAAQREEWRATAGGDVAGGRDIAADKLGADVSAIPIM